MAGSVSEDAARKRGDACAGNNPSNRACLDRAEGEGILTGIMPSPLTIIVQNVDTPRAAVVVSLEGTLDGITGSELDQALTNQKLSKGKRLIFDLSKLNYIASNGISIFIRWQYQLGGDVHLAAPANAVAQVFRILGLSTVFPIHASVDAAMAFEKKA
jgi:anti-anti-sigma factor